MNSEITSLDELPRAHIHALLSARWFGWKINRGTDLFVSSVSKVELNDLVDLGFMRKNRFSWEVTLQGRQLVGDRSLSY